MRTAQIANREPTATAVELGTDACKPGHAIRTQVICAGNDTFACPYCDMQHADISGYTLHVIRRHGEGRVV